MEPSIKTAIEEWRINVSGLTTRYFSAGNEGLPVVLKVMEGSELTLFEKVFEHELLKHKQTTTGLLIHKAAQVVGADIEAAIAPLNAVNFENRAHQEQLKGILEILGVRQLTGQEPYQGLWGRV